MKILTNKYLEKYKKSLKNFEKNLESFSSIQGTLDFDYLTQTGSVFSSNIEGNSLDVNSFMNAKKFGKKTKEVEEIQSLIKAYEFAKQNKLTLQNFLKTHELSSKTILIKSKRGVLREEPVGVFGKSGLIYLAIEPEFVEKEINKLFSDIEFLLKSKLSNQEVFYYASYIHLVFVHIHPFPDGNGRTARLLEKRFLTEKLGKEFSNISSEENYWKNRNLYYENINLGVNYYELNYDKSLNFLLMLPNSLKI